MHTHSYVCTILCLDASCRATSNAVLYPASHRQCGNEAIRLNIKAAGDLVFSGLLGVSWKKATVGISCLSLNKLTKSYLNRGVSWGGVSPACSLVSYHF